MTELMEHEPPHCERTEQRVLGAMLWHPDTIDIACSILERDDFFIQSHQVIFECVRDLHERGSGTDSVTVGNGLADVGLLDNVGGYSYLDALADAVPTGRHVRDHCEIVRTHATRRKLIVVGHQMTHEGFSRHLAPADIVI